MSKTACLYEIIVYICGKFNIKNIKYMEILSAKDFCRNLKATIQASGRLSFTAETAAEFNLESNKYIKLASNGEDGILYIAIMQKADPDAFKVCSAGEYYYLPTKNLFDTLGYDYAKRKIMFDIIRKSDLDEELKGTAYTMKRRYGKDK